MVVLHYETAARAARSLPSHTNTTESLRTRLMPFSDAFFHSSVCAAAAGASRLQSLPCLRTSPRRLRSTCTCSHGRGASRTPSRRCSRPLGRGCAARAR
eukprot:6262274-Prymnesium_polylepis.1